MIWLVGADGMLGTEVKSELEQLARPFVATDRDVDMTDSAAVERFCRGKAINWIINCAAYTDVDRAEKEEKIAFDTNADGPANLAAAGREKGAALIHVSTDYVFDGTANDPYEVSDPTNPVSVYGRSKLAGEQAVAGVLAQHFIVRTAWLYGTQGKNFPMAMIRLMNERDEIRVVSDQRGTPTFAGDLARCLVQLIALDCSEYGTYHYTNDGETTWYEFAREIYRIGRARRAIASECRITAVPSSQYPTEATRPAYSVLSKARIASLIGGHIPDWRDGLLRFYDQYLNRKEG